MSQHAPSTASVVVGVLYALLCAGAITGVVVYLVREDGTMAMAYMLLSALLIGLAIYIGRQGQEERRQRQRDEQQPPPPVVGLAPQQRRQPPGSGNVGRRWP